MKKIRKLIPCKKIKYKSKEEAQQVYFKCMEGDKEAQVNQSYDIEEGYVGVPGHQYTD